MSRAIFIQCRIDFVTVHVALVAGFPPSGLVDGRACARLIYAVSQCLGFSVGAGGGLAGWQGTH